MNNEICEHNSIKDLCPACKDVEIERLERENERLKADLEKYDAIMYRLREICEKPYAAKHGKDLTTESGWGWEMVHFLHHKLDENERLREALRQYGKHVELCGVHFSTHGKCDCGLAALAQKEEGK